MTLLAALTIAAAGAPQAQTVITGQVNEAIIVLEPATLFDEAASGLILLPNGSSLTGRELVDACLQRSTAVTGLLVFAIQSRRCYAVAEYPPPPTDRGRLDLGITPLNDGRLGVEPFTLVLPPGERGFLVLVVLIFANGFE